MRSKKVVFLLIFIMIMALLSSGCIFSVGLVIEAISDQTGKVGQEFIYQVIAYDPDNDELTYSLTEKPEGMQIESSTGLISWVPGEGQVGTFTVEVKVSDGNSFNVEKFEVTIEDIYLISIEVSPATINVYVGNSNTITSVTAHYNNGDSADLALADCNYSSSNTGIVTVSGSGVITGVSAGTAVITITYTEGSIIKTDTVEVTVSEIPKVLTSITVLPAVMTIRKGQSQTIDSVTAYYNNAPPANIELSACSYQSNVTNVTVTNGVIKVSSICAATTAIITVSYTEGGVTESDTVNVTITGGG